MYIFYKYGACKVCLWTLSLYTSSTCTHQIEGGQSHSHAAQSTSCIHGFLCICSVTSYLAVQVLDREAERELAQLRREKQQGKKEREEQLAAAWEEG